MQIYKYNTLTQAAQNWELLPHLPEFDKLLEFSNQTNCNLGRMYTSTFPSKSMQGFDLLSALLEYDPDKRLSAQKALEHAFFKEQPLPCKKWVFL